jgi:hypothetical protein
LEIQSGSVQLLVKSGSGACRCASLFVGCEAVGRLPHIHLTMLLPALERSPEGKTILSIEFGEVELNPKMHRAEALILNFTDGTAIAIKVGSNATDLATLKRKLKPSDFITDLMIFWAPSAY